MNGTGYHDEPREPIRRRGRGSFYPGTRQRWGRSPRSQRCPPSRGRDERNVAAASWDRPVYSRAQR